MATRRARRVPPGKDSSGIPYEQRERIRQEATKRLQDAFSVERQLDNRRSAAAAQRGGQDLVDGETGKRRDLIDGSTGEPRQQTVGKGGPGLRAPTRLPGRPSMPQRPPGPTPGKPAGPGGNPRLDFLASHRRGTESASGLAGFIARALGKQPRQPDEPTSTKQMDPEAALVAQRLKAPTRKRRKVLGVG